MTGLIVFGLTLYLAIGLFINGFLDITVEIDRVLFFMMIFIWPIFIALFVLTVMVRIPLRFGKKLSDKYLPIVDYMVDKLLSN